jgi:predicted O-methyltransferase YrrM
MNKPDFITEFIEKNLHHDPVANAAVFNTLRILKKHNPGDTYYEAYLGHYQKRGRNFFDYYHLLWAMGSQLELNNVMEIGCRTGISICQLLSAMPDPKVPEVYLFDVFNDGFISQEVVKMNLKALNLPTEKIHFIVGDSLNTVPEFKKDKDLKFQYILVDGCHDPAVAKQDLINVVPLLDQGGILAVDDIAEDGCNLIDVWEDFRDAHYPEFNFMLNLDGKGVGVGVKR